MADKKAKAPAHREHDPAAQAAAAKKEKPKLPETVKARCVLGFRVSREETVAPGETVELPYRDFTALKLAGKVIAEDDAPSKKGRPKKAAE